VAVRYMTAHEIELERELLRKSVGDLAAGRPRCHDCRRTPLTGERTYVYDRGQVVCALCRLLRSEEPLRCEQVRGAEHGNAVRLRIRAAA